MRWGGHGSFDEATEAMVALCPLSLLGCDAHDWQLRTIRPVVRPGFHFRRSRAGNNNSKMGASA